jgi:hypothetical protein
MSTPDSARETGQFFLALCARRRRRDIGDRCFRVEIDSLNGPRTVTLFEMDLRRRVDSFDSEALIRQLKRQRHREAPGMSGAEQLFRIGALAVAHA